MKHMTIGALACLIAGASFAENKPGEHFLKSWDANEDGVVTLDEVFLKRENVFASFDADENGFLDAEEYVVFDEARANDQANHGKGGGEGKLHEAMTLEYNDLDKDGVVSYAEFLVQSKAFLVLADRNEDGVLSSDDFGH